MLPTMEHQRPGAPEPEGKMISFRAPEDVATSLAKAEFLTGRTRTELLHQLTREYLPALVHRLSADHARALDEAKAAYLRDHPSPPPAPAVKPQPAKYKIKRRKK